MRSCAQPEKPQPPPLLPQRPAHSRASSEPSHPPLPIRCIPWYALHTFGLDWIKNLRQAVWLCGQTRPRVPQPFWRKSQTQK